MKEQRNWTSVGYQRMMALVSGLGTMHRVVRKRLLNCIRLTR
ncbi:hypothetical protein [Veronia pacifica]|nr:hypothetical protein [Veronia pacifica]